MSENRVELNEQDLEGVVGGAFLYSTYTNPDGSEYMKCKVTGGYGTYQCTDNAKNKISKYIVGHPEATVQDIIDYAVNSGLFWK